ncbi:hypothetical protein V3481_005448 [Fusarium oxysporum f. sp. vasinfectum]
MHFSALSIEELFDAGFLHKQPSWQVLAGVSFSIRSRSLGGLATFGLLYCSKSQTYQLFVRTNANSALTHAKYAQVCSFILQALLSWNLYLQEVFDFQFALFRRLHSGSDATES